MSERDRLGIRGLVPPRALTLDIQVGGGREDIVCEGGREECVGFASGASCHPGHSRWTSRWVEGREGFPSGSGYHQAASASASPRLSTHTLLSGHAGPAPHLPPSDPPPFLCRLSASWKSTAARASSPQRWPRWEASRRRWLGGALGGGEGRGIIADRMTLRGMGGVFANSGVDRWHARLPMRTFPCAHASGILAARALAHMPMRCAP